MEDPAYLTLTVQGSIIEGPRRYGPGDAIALCRSGRTYLVREIPNNPGRWLGYYMDDLVIARSHSSDETASELIRLSSPSPSSAPGARGRRSCRTRRQPRAG